MDRELGNYAPLRLGLVKRDAINANYSDRGITRLALARECAQGSADV
jgi:hypothetical protein